MSTLSFITRRVPAPAVDAPHSRGIDLSGRQASEEPAIPAPPMLSADVTLTKANPVVRLSALMSGVGSLTISNAVNALVETCDMSAHAPGERSMPQPGNRGLLELRSGALLVSLRHVRLIRRLVVSGDGVTFVTAFGSQVTVAGSAHTCMSVIDGQIEIRRDEPTGPLTTAYRIGTDS